MQERTLSIIKPDAYSSAVIGEIIKRYETQGFKIVAIKKLKLSKRQAEGFYHVHRKQPFFDSLTTFMASGPIVVSVLEGEGVVNRHRNMIGPTNPKNAQVGTIRGDFGSDIEHNAVHGSDSLETASFEIAYFFGQYEFIE